MSYGIRESSYNEFPAHERRSPSRDWRDTLALGRDNQPFWWPFGYTLQPQVTQDSAIAPISQFKALKIMSVASQAKGFRTQLRQTADNLGGGFSFSKVGIEQSNFATPFGATIQQRPLFLRHPYPAPELMTILNRCANKAIATDAPAGVNRIQIVIQGVRVGTTAAE